MGERETNMSQPQPSVTELKQGIAQQLQQQQLQTMIQSMGKLCFNKCISKPGSKLSSGESRCVAQCQDQFLESLKAINDVFVQMSQQQNGGAGAGGSWRYSAEARLATALETM